MAIFDLFSKRDKPLPDVLQTRELPVKLRVQIEYIWQETLYKHNSSLGFLEELHRIICEERGQYRLSGGNTAMEDLRHTLLCDEDTDKVLDVIEGSAQFICKLEEIREAPITFYDPRPVYTHEDIEGFIEKMNHRFLEHGVGYQFDINANRLLPIGATFAHKQVVQPALAVLSRKEFTNANKEFMEAWDDFKKSDFDDCLTKCCSCFESVMKIICTKKGWAFDPKDTAAPLIKTIITNTGLDSFFEQPLLLIATMRNRLSSSHGAGTMPKNPPEHIARYALNATASAILLLVEATGV